VRSQNKVSESAPILFVKNKVRFARVEQLCSVASHFISPAVVSWPHFSASLLGSCHRNETHWQGFEPNPRTWRTRTQPDQNSVMWVLVRFGRAPHV